MEIDRPIITAIIFFVILILALFLVVPEYNNFKQLQADLSVQIAERNSKHDYYATIEKIYSDLQETQEDLVKIDDALPGESSLGEVIYFIQESARESALMLKNLSISQITGGVGSNVKEISLVADVAGSFPSLENFLIALEKSSRILEIVNISFGVAEQGAIQNFSLQIKTFSY
jgi:Tfp pilus assembly protein PilO